MHAALSTVAAALLALGALWSLAGERAGGERAGRSPDDGPPAAFVYPGN
ncbi:MAG: hypothetical protein ACFCVK_18040 [Acidimicrobiales bacterium]